MKKIVFMFLLIPSTLYAQYLTWPILGKEAGGGVIYRPQDYIGEEHNPDCLIITAPEGTEILSPVSGKISACFYMFADRLNHGYTYTVTDQIDTKRRMEISHSMWDKHKKKADPKYVAITLGITTGQGEVYYISGIRPVENFKTGMRLKQCDKIGTIGYCYKAIKQPAISISRSINNRPADPMTPFGLKSTFRSLGKEKKAQDQYKATQLQADFLVLKQSLEEGHPGLYDYCSKQHMDSLFSDAYKKIADGMNTYEFYRLVYSLVSKIRDGHLYVSHVSNPNPKLPVYPTIAFSLFDGILQVSRVTNEKDLDLIGKKIVAVDGIELNKLKTEIATMNKENDFIHDGFIQSISTVNRGIFFYSDYIENYPLKKDGITLTFADGTERIFPFGDKKCLSLLPYVKYRLRPKVDVIYRKIDEITALLDVNTFQLSDMDYDSIGVFIRDISKDKCENLIIDVRNNSGGDFGKLFDYLANEPFRTAIGLQVNQNDTYAFFRYCSNYTSDDRYLFPGYLRNKEKGGYYLPKDSLPMYSPCESIHFNGRIYVLTDERSFSAASVFAGLVRKYKRGVIVGRETGSTYYQINAMKYANVMLEHSGLHIRIPLVKCIYDFPENSDIPWGRGVLPDYPLEFSVDELIGDKDIMIDYTLRLIKENHYLP